MCNELFEQLITVAFVAHLNPDSSINNTITLALKVC